MMINLYNHGQIYFLYVFSKYDKIVIIKMLKTHVSSIQSRKLQYTRSVILTCSLRHICQKFHFVKEYQFCIQTYHKNMNLFQSFSNPFQYIVLLMKTLQNHDKQILTVTLSRQRGRVCRAVPILVALPKGSAWLESTLDLGITRNKTQNPMASHVTQPVWWVHLISKKT